MNKQTTTTETTTTEITNEIYDMMVEYIDDYLTQDFYDKYTQADSFGNYEDIRNLFMEDWTDEDIKDLYEELKESLDKKEKLNEEALDKITELGWNICDIEELKEELADDILYGKYGNLEVIWNNDGTIITEITYEPIAEQQSWSFGKGVE